MPSHGSRDSRASVVLTPRMKLHYGSQWHGTAQVASPDGAVLGGGESTDVTANLSVFSAAEPAITLDVQAPSAAVLGEDQAGTGTLEYQPEENAVYALLQAIETSDGIIYDFTLPQRSADAGGMVLGDNAQTTLRFPVNPIALDLTQPPTDPQSAVLGLDEFFGGVIGGQVGGIIVKRVLQVIKAPIEHALIDAIRKTEGEPWVGALGSAEIRPIQGFEGWRALLPPGGERRVLLFIHGFTSSLATNYTNQWIGQFAQGYDAVLGYNHPTIWCDPEQNAVELLKLIPDDLRLSVDLLAHSRGGLVARSLVELVEPRAQFNVRRVITNGTPHAGTRLADPERWDRLVSIGMTAASWLAATAGAAVWIPKALELVLKAAAQIVFDLPGIGAMTPSGAFLQKLNASADPASAQAQAQANATYTAISSRFSVFGVPHPAFQQALNAFAVQAFIDAPNDLVVPTESMTMIDKVGSVSMDHQILVGNDHFNYFNDKQVVDFIRAQLVG